MTDSILDFAEIQGDTLALVGGKAGNLGELTRAGLPVPPGFCLTTVAYQQATAGTDLSEIFDALEHTSTTDLPALTALAEKARAAILAAPIPGDIADAVTTA